MAKKMLPLSVVIITMIYLCCCNQSNNSSDSQAQRNIVSKIEWKSGSPTASSRSIINLKMRSTVNNADYSKYGKLIEKLTPTTFRIPLQSVELANEHSCFFPIPFHQFDTTNQKWIFQYGDFTNPLITVPEGEITTGKYTDFTLLFLPSAGGMDFSSTPGIRGEYCSEVVVDLPPGYENYITTNEQFITSSATTVFYNKQIIDSSKSRYKFLLHALYPKDESGKSIEQFVFTFSGDTYKVYFPGLNGVPEFYNISDYKKTPGTGIGGNLIYTVVPWSGIEIDTEASSIIFELYLDLNGIIELYDNNTPDIITDDILVLADNFWERFNLIARQFDVSGQELIR